MRTDRQQEDCFTAILLHEFKEQPQIIACGACPNAIKFARKFMCSKSMVEGILFKKNKRGFNVGDNFRVFL